jgi:hypothetical protein
VGKNFTILHYTGQAWKTVQYQPSAHHLNDIWGTSSTHILAVGAKGTIMRYNGSEWKDESPFPDKGKDDKMLHGLWGASANDLWVSGAQGVILHYDSQWKMSMSTTGHYYKVWGSSANDVWVVGTKNTIWHFNGSLWSSQAIVSPGGTLFGIFGISPSTFWAVGETEEGGIKRPLMLRYMAGGFVAHPQGSAVEGRLARVWVSPSGKAWAVGSTANESKGLILHFNGSDWLNVTPGDIPPQNAVWGFSDSEIWSVGNGGSTWNCSAL